MRTLTSQKPLFAFLILFSFVANADMYEPATATAQDLVVDYQVEKLNPENDQGLNLDGSVSFKIDNSKIKQSTRPDAGVSDRMGMLMNLMRHFSAEEFLANVLIQPHIQECLKASGSPDDQPLITRITKRGNKTEAVYDIEVTSRVRGDGIVFAGTRHYEVYMKTGEDDFHQAGCVLLMNNETGH